MGILTTEPQSRSVPLKEIYAGKVGFTIRNSNRRNIKKELKASGEETNNGRTMGQAKSIYDTRFRGHMFSIFSRVLGSFYLNRLSRPACWLHVLRHLHCDDLSPGTDLIFCRDGCVNNDLATFYFLNFCSNLQ